MSNSDSLYSCYDYYRYFMEYEMNVESQTIKVTWEATDNLYKANKWLNDLAPLAAYDFEVGSAYNDKQKKLIKYKLDNYSMSFEDRRQLLQNLESDGLSHPSLTVITHLSIANSDHEGKVIICSSNAIRKLILNYLVTTDKLQLWHNIGYDGRIIYYHTGKLPKRYIDTQLLAKTILNDANPARDNTGLKTLMSYCYGAWSIAKDNLFNQENMWDTRMLEYAATDACATYKLYQDIINDITHSNWSI